MESQYTSQQISDMHSRLSFGFPLDVDEQKWLWNEAAACVSGNQSIRDLGRLPPPRKRCDMCHGTGVNPERVTPAGGSTVYQAPCRYCHGTGYQRNPA